MRKTFDSKFKAYVALEAIKEDKTLAEIASIYEVYPNQVGRWKKEALDKTARAFPRRQKETQK